MNRKVKSLVVILALTFLFSIMLSSTVEAQLYVRNKTNSDIWFAVVYWSKGTGASVTATGTIDSGTPAGWVSQGWWYIKPGQRVKIWNKLNPNQHIYYYAEDEGDGKWTGSYKFLVNHDDDFKLRRKEDNTITSADRRKGYTLEGFREKNLVNS